MSLPPISLPPPRPPSPPSRRRKIREGRGGGGVRVRKDAWWGWMGRKSRVAHWLGDQAGRACACVRVRACVRVSVCAGATARHISFINSNKGRYSA